MKENNELLAKFLGYAQSNPDSTYWYKEGKAPLTILLFDTDWNWLMEVIEKILDIASKLKRMQIYYNIIDAMPSIRFAYESCVEFVKWYNENN